MTARAGMRPRRIVYVQYTNPAGYPPLEHSSRILADAGWDVLFLGAEAFGADSFKLPQHPSIEVLRLRSFGRGLRQRVNYASFLAWVASVCIMRRPMWIYASDAMSCPAALAARAACGAKLLYHEHDTPPYGSRVSALQRVVRRARGVVARTADLCVLPQQQRLNAFVKETGRIGPGICVWNCPRLDETAPARASLDRKAGLAFYYHGSLNPERLPLSVVEALARTGEAARLIVVGYETVGSRGYVRELLRRASELGVDGRIEYRGPMDRASMLRVAGEADVGLAFMPASTKDINMTYMTGASNKPFDYLAVGQMLLVSDLPDWRDMFVTPGYGQVCDPYDPADLSRAMRWCVEHPEEVRAAGEAGRRRILSEWNYERGFDPVRKMLEAGFDRPRE